MYIPLKMTFNQYDIITLHLYLHIILVQKVI